MSYDNSPQRVESEESEMSICTMCMIGNPYITESQNRWNVIAFRASGFVVGNGVSVEVSSKEPKPSDVAEGSNVATGNGGGANSPSQVGGV